jgi:hypothetical protein
LGTDLVDWCCRAGWCRNIYQDLNHIYSTTTQYSLSTYDWFVLQIFYWTQQGCLSI